MFRWKKLAPCKTVEWPSTTLLLQKLYCNGLLLEHHNVFDCIVIIYWKIYEISFQRLKNNLWTKFEPQNGINGSVVSCLLPTFPYKANFLIANYHSHSRNKWKKTLKTFNIYNNKTITFWTDGTSHMRNRLCIWQQTTPQPLRKRFCKSILFLLYTYYSYCNAKRFISAHPVNSLQS